METELTVKNEDLQKAYDNGCDEVKKTLKNLYPDFFVRKLPKSWGEYCEISNIDRKAFDKLWSILPPKYKALRKLECLRDHHNNGWVPDWKNIYEIKYTLRNRENLYSRWIEIHSGQIPGFMTLKTQELANEFLTNFEDLIEEAGDLI